MECFMSKNSNVFHGKGCKYIAQIKKSNKRTVGKKTIRQKCYEPCKCCGTMAYRFKFDQNRVDAFVNGRNMSYKLIGNAIYVLTDMAYWRINYNPNKIWFYLYHGCRYPVYDRPEAYTQATYHYQGDFGRTDKLMDCFRYIREHDDFRKDELMNCANMPKRTNKQKKAYRLKFKKKRLYDIANTLRLIDRLKKAKAA